MFLCFGNKVGVAIGDGNALVPHPVGDCHGGEAKVDQERHVAVPQVVNPDLLDPCKLCGGLQGVVEGVLGKREETFVFVRLPLHLHVFLELLREESWRAMTLSDFFVFGLPMMSLPFRRL